MSILGGTYPAYDAFFLQPSEVSLYGLPAQSQKLCQELCIYCDIYCDIHLAGFVCLWLFFSLVLSECLEYFSNISYL